MLAVVRKPHTNTMLFEIKGHIPSQVLGYIQQQFGQDVEIIEDEEELVNIFETSWYKQISTTPGDAMTVYRENHALTPADLAKKLGNLTTKEISEIECNKREINKELAKNLSQLFQVPVDRFL